MGIPRGREWELEDDDAEEIALRQVFDNLDTDGDRSDSEPPPVASPHRLFPLFPHHLRLRLRRHRSSFPTSMKSI
ncbi:hypothetical protein B5P46_01755 [Rhizobium leguminosarum]|uniref:Uncharacterized protein n=1 Tax=Rhizobium leguminosarum TaxID=384 RepID=A0A4Q1UDS7_RHILE|nr:hypothetical protein B5P46_01755 [Rhizobium leguminosarum]